ncbi:MAG: hypothetical protein KGH62_01810 [Candidatus Micrarchaeota archaeon]|nr:hypothetical protein [Candidatus Micrarchaeota archaeon]
METSKNNSYLRSRLVLKASILVKMDDLRSKMDAYPHCKLLGYGESLKYIVKSEGEDQFYIIELAKSAIIFDSYTINSPLYSMNEMLLRIISIALLLNNDYSIEANTLLPYVLNAISRQPTIQEKQNVNLSRDGYRILSRRIISLISINKKLSKEFDLIYRDFLKTAAALVSTKYISNTNFNQICEETGLSQKQVSETIEYLKKNGNKLIFNSKGNFDIVKV